MCTYTHNVLYLYAHTVQVDGLYIKYYGCLACVLVTLQISLGISAFNWNWSLSHTHGDTHTQTDTHTYMYMYTHTHTHTDKHTHTHTCTHTHTHTYTQVHTHTQGSIDAHTIFQAATKWLCRLQEEEETRTENYVIHKIKREEPNMAVNKWGVNNQAKLQINNRCD
jgi:hypothetical protein